MTRDNSHQIRSATFVAETRGLASLPPIGPPEVAISGRSNVGKSTLLNRLAERKSLARTSKTPGRTRGIIFYDLQIGPGTERFVRLADLPGYGYAKVSQAERVSWQALIEGYAERRPTLALFIVLCDARRGMESEERQLVHWLATLGVPTQVVFTKVDKLSASDRGRLRASLRPGLPGPALRRPLLVSGETGEGVPAVWEEVMRASAPSAAAADPSAAADPDDADPAARGAKFADDEPPA